MTHDNKTSGWHKTHLNIIRNVPDSGEQTVVDIIKHFAKIAGSKTKYYIYVQSENGARIETTNLSEEELKNLRS